MFIRNADVTVFGATSVTPWTEQETIGGETTFHTTIESYHGSQRAKVELKVLKSEVSAVRRQLGLAPPITATKPKSNAGAIVAVGVFAGVATSLAIVLLLSLLEPGMSSSAKREAVRSGHAEYVAGEDDKPVWRWKDAAK